jgi:hypothetical protein
MALSVTIHSKSNVGEQFQITLEKTGATKGMIRNQSWTSEHNPAKDHADTDDLVKLYDIAVNSDGNTIVCKGDVSGPDPTVTCKFFSSHAGKPAAVEVAIVGTFGGFFDRTERLPIEQADFDNLKTFVANAKFPTST